MQRDSAQKLIQETLQSSFNKERFIYLVKNVLNHVEEAPFTYKGNLVFDDFADSIQNVERIGKYQDTEEKLIDVLIVRLKKEASLDRARTKQRNFVAKYLKGSRGGVLKDAALVAFVPPNEDDWRFSLVKMEYKFNEKGKVEEEFTPARRYSFLVGKHENSHTAQSRLLPLLLNDEVNPTFKELEDVFSVEKVTKEFFEKYRELFLGFKEALDEIVKKDKKVQEDFKTKGVNTADFTKKLLGQIVFLYFLQKKGWFGVERNKEWGSGSKRFLRELFEKKHGDYNNFFNEILEPLFYEALRLERSGDYYSRFDCRIPFLNGGLFDPLNDYDWVDTEIELPNEIFSNEIKDTKTGDVGTGILDVFDRYNFTVKEDEPLEKEVAVDPEMLGKVFENLLEVKDRKSKGTYYTPREIVHYMCQESLANYLATELEGEASKEDIETLIKYGESVVEHDSRVVNEGRETERYSFKLPQSVRKYAKEIDDRLASIRVCDPAVGSGAFPVGMMNEVIRTRNALTPYIGKDGDRTAYNFKRHAIQNCLYGVDIDAGAVEIAKLRLWLSLIVDEEERETIQPLPNLDYKIVQGNSLLSVEKNLFNASLFSKLEEIKPLYFNETSASKKQGYKEKISELINQITNGRKDFDFEVYFSEVFHEKKGFDVVIANPPYNAKLTENEKRLYKTKYESVKTGRQDTAAIFVEIAKVIGNPNMELSYILPYRLFSRKRNHGQFQKYTLNNFSIRNILYLGANIGFTASDEFMILLMTSKSISSNIIKVAFKPSIENLNHATFSKVDQNLFVEREEINLNLTRFNPNLISKIEVDTIRLENICYVKDGIVPFLREKLISEKKKDDRYVKFAGIAGRYTLQKYFFEYDELYLCYDINEAKKYIKDPIELRKVQFREREIFLQRKILTAQNSSVLKGAIDESKVFVSNSLHSTYLRTEYEKKFSLEFILALINSNLINYYHDSLRLKATDLHPQILVSNIKKLPIKNVFLDKQKPFIQVVNKITAITKDGDYLENPVKQAQVSEYEKQIDQLVYKLYGLTKEEIKIVENEK